MNCCSITISQVIIYGGPYRQHKYIFSVEIYICSVHRYIFTIHRYIFSVEIYIFSTHIFPRPQRSSTTSSSQPGAKFCSNCGLCLEESFCFCFCPKCVNQINNAIGNDNKVVKTVKPSCSTSNTSRFSLPRFAAFKSKERNGTIEEIRFLKRVSV